MALHDWSKVDDGMFHDFHNSWLLRMKDALNRGLLPAGYFAQTDQFSEGYFADVLAFTKSTDRSRSKHPTADGGVALAEPDVDKRIVAKTIIQYPRRRIAVRQSGSRKVVAVIELVSQSNKDRQESVWEFAGKVSDLLSCGIHVLMIDILPPNRSAPQGMHVPIWASVEGRHVDTSGTAKRPLLVVGYRALRKPIAYLHYATVNKPLPDGPLYLDGERFVNVPLNATYQATFESIPAELAEDLLR